VILVRFDHIARIIVNANHSAPSLVAFTIGPFFQQSWVIVKYWEIIADNLSKAGWSWGCVSVIARSAQGVAHLSGLSAESRRGLNAMDNPATPTPEDEV
jgi:hypothetical protein